jgi:superfamily I DNA/RNA helicase/RecB family exonuclease
LGLRGFAREVCDFLDRARERGLDADDVRALGQEHDRPMWVAAGAFMAEYNGVLFLRDEIDYTGLIARAVELLKGRAKDECRRYRAVYVDEYQDTDPSQVQLLRLLAGDGRLLVVVGDPDQSIYAFRGADMRGITDFRDEFRTANGDRAPIQALTVCRRSGEPLVAASRAVARGLPLTGALAADARQHRKLRADGPDAAAPEIRLFSSVASEVAGIADLLRRNHLHDGLAWSQMAVLVRSGVRSIPTIRRALVAAGVPVSVAADELPLSRDPAVAPLLRALEVVVERTRQRGRPPQPVTPETARLLLTSPLAGASPAQLRALGRRLRDLDRIATGALPRSSAVLLAEAVDDPSAALLIDDWVAAPLRRLTRLLADAERVAHEGGAPAEVLWALWDGSDWARRLASATATPDATGRAADRDLDAVLALFDVANRLAEQQPRATAAALLEEVASQEIPAAPYEERAAAADSVRLLTAHRSKGLEWDLVVVAGLQEDVWPDLRRRGSLLDADLLDRDGPRQPPAPRELLADERRLFYVAITRARRRLVLTATSGGDEVAERPSRFLTETGLPLPDRLTPVTEVLSAPSLVAQLRRTLVDPDSDEQQKLLAAECLGQLAAAADEESGEPLVPAASPSRWWGLATETPGLRAVRDPDQPLDLSGSAVASFERCPRAWFLEREARAAESTSTAQGFGSIVHALAEAVVVGELPPDLDALVARLDEVWHLLPYDARWQAARDHVEAKAALQRFLAWHALNPRECAGAEIEFTVPVGDDVVVRGRADRIELDESGRVVVVDLKTTRNPPSEAKVASDPQLGVYQLAVRHGAFAQWSTEPGGAELVQLRKSVRDQVKVQRQDALGADDGWVDELVGGVAAAIRGETFAARPNDRCGNCRFRTSCPSQTDGEQVVT